MATRHKALRNRITVFLIGMTLAMAAPACIAAQSAEHSEADTWKFEITPYLLAAGLNGTVGIGGVTADVDKSFNDILQNLDSGFMALFEARKDRWTFGLEGVYFKLKDEGAKSWQGPLGSTSSGSLEATLTEQLYQLSAGYRVLDEHTKVDVLAAARYTQLDTKLNLTVTTGSDLLPDGSRSVSATQSWWDPVIGVRVLVPLAKAWTLVGYADIGGTNSSSDFTYQLLAGVNWQFSKSVSAKAGYRYLYQDYEHDNFIWDMTTSGFYLGVGFRF